MALSNSTFLCNIKGKHLLNLDPDLFYEDELEPEKYYEVYAKPFIPGEYVVDVIDRSEKKIITKTMDTKQYLIFEHKLKLLLEMLERE